MEKSGNLSMADTTTGPATTTAASGHNSVPEKPESETQPGPSTLDQSSMALPQFSNPNPRASPLLLTPPHTTIQSSIGPTTTQIPLPVPVPVPSMVAGQQFMGVPSYQTPGVPPPGVGTGMVQQVIAPQYAMAGQPLRYMPPIPNGYMGFPQAVSPGVMPPPGIPRYPMQYAPMIRPAFPPRPLVGVMPLLARPPVVGIRGPTTQLVVRPPAAPTVVSAEKPQTTVYVGKISSTVENDFMLSLLQLCGPVKSWKRPQDPTGTLKGFGFCEFESAEGVLRALRLLNKLNIDRQELMLNVNQPTRVYLDHYVEKKVESSNSKDSNSESAEKEELKTSGADTNGTSQSSEESEMPSDKEKKNYDETSSKENSDSANFGLVTKEDSVADREALEKLKGMIEERLRDRPLPPPRPQTVDGPGGDSTSELHSVSRDQDSDGDVAEKDSEYKVEDEKTAESELSGYVDKNRTSSPDRNRRGDRSKDRDRESKRDKEREVDRYEREREQERAKREKDKEHRTRDDDRRYKVREKEWETREREREHWRKREREREREKAQERKWEIMDQERNSDDAYGKKRRHRTSDEERKRRQREKEEDSADRFREEEEIAEAKIRDEEEQKKKQYEMLQMIANQSADETGNAVLPNKTSSEDRDKDADESSDGKSIGGISKGEVDLSNGIGDDSITSLNTVADTQQSINVPTRKLGFGLSASGKRTAVPSVFNEDEDEDAQKDKKMRPLVPIDYSTEEQQAVQSNFEGPDHMVAAAEFAKRISTGNSKEDRPDLERERGRRSHERSNHREQDRHEEEGYRKEKKTKSPEKQKIMDAKQLIDTIPKTKDDLFSYNINWTVYDLNALHERLRPWISKKIADFLGEEEDTLVDYIVSTTQEHVSANEMLDRLQTILDDEAEMFVLKMWRMLIFEIKKVETGLTVKSRS